MTTTTVPLTRREYDLLVEAGVVDPVEERTVVHRDPDVSSAAYGSTETVSLGESVAPLCLAETPVAPEIPS